MLRVIKVTGDSLYPRIRQGDFVVISKIPFLLNSLRPGDVVVFQHTILGILIKQIERISADRQSFFVMGTAPDSVDSRQFGAIRRHDLLGKVIWHIPGPR
jgi:signal peptidase I